MLAVVISGRRESGRIVAGRRVVVGVVEVVAVVLVVLVVLKIVVVVGEDGIGVVDCFGNTGCCCS